MKTACSAVFGLALVLSCTFASAQTVTLSDNEKTYVLQQARDLQYNLRTAGMEELRCEVHPDWNSFFQQLGIDTTSPQSLVPLLKRVHFNVTLDRDGNVGVTHTSVPSPNAGTAAAMRGALHGMDEVIADFFKVWAMYTVTSPLPAPSIDYVVRPVDDNYVVSYRQGSSQVRTTLNSEFAITEATYSSPEFSIEVRPSWDTGNYGYRLAQYEGISQIGSGERLSEQVQIAYGTEGGMQLPETVREQLAATKRNIEVTLEISQYQVKRLGIDKEPITVRASSALCGTGSR